MRVTPGIAALLGVGFVALSSPAEPPTTPRDGAIERLKPGEYLWAPQFAPNGPVTVIVSLATQRAYAYRNGVPIGVSTVSTGKPGHATPTGIFTILQKDADHKSSLYDDAPMPFMQRLTWDGIALHAGRLPGYPASHGCVRLPLAFARLLFGVTKIGLTVIVTGDALMPIVAAKPVLDQADEDGHRAASGYSWHPERSPDGPLSIVVSGADRRVIVLRNGVEIGSSGIRLDGPVAATSAFTLASVDAAGPHWLRLPVPGQPPAAGELTEEERGAGHLPDGFRRALEAIVRPGATMLVTRDTLIGSGTGTRLNLLQAEAPSR